LTLQLHRKRFPKIAFLLFLTGFLTPSAASAHLVNSGVGPFYDGVAHFFVSPEDLVVVMALAIFGGLSGRKSARLLVIVLPVAWLAGAVLGLHIAGPRAIAILPAVGILATGILVAINPKVPRLFPAILASSLGLVHGFLNGQAMVATNTPFLAAVGITSALGLVGILLGALVVSLQANWQTIAVRVLGSWAAAIGLLSLAWNLRSGA
jgi:hydrogenase/urease accessory protein HupE